MLTQLSASFESLQSKSEQTNAWPKEAGVIVHGSEPTSVPTFVPTSRTSFCNRFIQCLPFTPLPLTAPSFLLARSPAPALQAVLLRSSVRPDHLLSYQQRTGRACSAVIRRRHGQYIKRQIGARPACCGRVHTKTAFAITERSCSWFYLKVTTSYYFLVVLPSTSCVLKERQVSTFFLFLKNDLFQTFSILSSATFQRIRSLQFFNQNSTYASYALALWTLLALRTAPCRAVLRLLL